ncbi:hypothetical protein [Campylobacter lanienae]|uniref:invasion protein CiaB n=1 Tax=Campylobacter lanienae TaxID=75658 RepID=UPI00191C8EA5|nr:hypothetical protein [Campylobacter lanienae]
MAVIKAVSSKAGIGHAIDYVTKKEKTEEKLVSGLHCEPETVKQSYEKFKSLTLENYIDLASYYTKKINASEFLAKFAYFDGEIYLPNDAEVANFVKYYYNRYEMIGNEIDESDEWQKWQN